MEIHSVVLEHPILAIMRNIPLEKTVEYAGMAVRGGVSFFEVALNSEHALEQIHMLRDSMGDRCMIGAGTAVTVEKAREAMAAGAQFLLTPGSPEDVLEFCAERNVAMLPGVMTPSDVAVCMKYGFKTMKLFPAGSMPQGYVKTLKGPFEDTEYVAIGGVNRNNIVRFLEEGYLGVGLASALVPPEIIKENRWEDGSEYIESLVKELREWRGGARDEDQGDQDL